MDSTSVTVTDSVPVKLLLELDASLSSNLFAPFASTPNRPVTAVFRPSSLPTEKLALPVLLPVSEPVFLDDVLTHLGDVSVDQDYYVGGLIAAARNNVEQVTRRQLVTATLKLTLDRFPCGPIIVPRPTQAAT